MDEPRFSIRGPFVDPAKEETYLRIHSQEYFERSGIGQFITVSEQENPEMFEFFLKHRRDY